MFVRTAEQEHSQTLLLAWEQKLKPAKDLYHLTSKVNYLHFLHMMLPHIYKLSLLVQRKSAERPMQQGWKDLRQQLQDGISYRIQKFVTNHQWELIREEIAMCPQLLQRSHCKTMDKAQLKDLEQHLLRKRLSVLAHSLLMGQEMEEELENSFMEIHKFLKQEILLKPESFSYAGLQATILQRAITAPFTVPQEMMEKLATSHLCELFAEVEEARRFYKEILIPTKIQPQDNQGNDNRITEQFRKLQAKKEDLARCKLALLRTQAQIRNTLASRKSLIL